jgi:hypothetical protein
MGIDAEMLVRKVSQDTVTDEWLKEKSWALCKAIGADSFFISDGLSPEEYEETEKAWHLAFDAHPLNSRCKAGDRSVHPEILKDIGEAPKCLRTAIRRTETLYRDEESKQPGTRYTQDGDDIFAEEGECLLKISLMGRYYGPGYERGDILSYCAIAEWLEQNIPGCEVWYGGDSSGCCAEPFGAEERAAMKAHLFSKNGRDYFNSWDMGEPLGAKPPACGLCPGGVYCGSKFGFGASYSAWSCGGCGKSVESRDGGATWQKQEDKV